MPLHLIFGLRFDISHLKDHKIIVTSDKLELNEWIVRKMGVYESYSSDFVWFAVMH